MNTSGHSSFTFCSLSRSLEACARSGQQSHSLDGPSAWDKRFEQPLPNSWSESFHNKRPGHRGNWRKKKNLIHNETEALATEEHKMISSASVNLHLKWLPDKHYNLLSQYRSFPPSRTFWNNAATRRSFPEVPPSPPDFGRPGMTPRPPAQFTDQLLQTWMLLDMATFELEKFNTKKCLVQSRFYFFFLKKEEEEEEITHILKKVKELVVNWTEALEQLQHRTCSNTVLSLTHMNLIPVECCWAKESVWGQTGLEAHWKTLHLNLKWRQKQRNGTEPAKWRRWEQMTAEAAAAHLSEWRDHWLLWL